MLMPTKALSLLAEGHRILGEDCHCCTINNVRFFSFFFFILYIFQGELLFFFIDELYNTFFEHRFEDHYYSKIVQRNIELQLIQCLKFMYNEIL